MIDYTLADHYISGDSYPKLKHISLCRLLFQVCETNVEYRFKAFQNTMLQRKMGFKRGCK